MNQPPLTRSTFLGRIVAAAAALCSLNGCSVSRPPQINLVLEVGPNRHQIVTAIAADLAQSLSMRITSARSAVPNGDKALQVEVYDRSNSIFIISAADGDCNSPPGGRITFREGRFNVNIVATREAGEAKLKQTAAVLRDLASRHGARLRTPANMCS